VLVLGGLGLAFALLIALTHRRFWVWEDPRIDAVANMLPNSNCGACGQAGCRAFAEGLVKGKVQPAECTVMGQGDREDVARAWLSNDLLEMINRGKPSRETP